MAKIKYIRHEEAQQKNWQNPEYRQAYRRLKPRYDILREIISLRHQKGITQKELAKAAKTHQSRVSRIESAELDVRLSTLINLAEALETEVQIQLIPRIPREEFREIAVLVGEEQVDSWSVPAYGPQQKVHEETLT